MPLSHQNDCQIYKQKPRSKIVDRIQDRNEIFARLWVTKEAFLVSTRREELRPFVEGGASVRDFHFMYI